MCIRDRADRLLPPASESFHDPARKDFSRPRARQERGRVQWKRRQGSARRRHAPRSRASGQGTRSCPTKAQGEGEPHAPADARAHSETQRLRLRSWRAGTERRRQARRVEARARARGRRKESGLRFVAAVRECERLERAPPRAPRVRAQTQKARERLWCGRIGSRRLWLQAYHSAFELPSCVTLASPRRSP